MKSTKRKGIRVQTRVKGGIIGILLPAPQKNHNARKARVAKSK